MEHHSPAVHRTIVVVDMERFTDPRRTNRHHLTMRSGLNAAVRRAVQRSHIAWPECHHEDRGDGMLLLIPPHVPKSTVLTVLLGHLAREIDDYNGRHSRLASVRVRVALHAGEISFDEHGVTAPSINDTFRLVEAQDLKETLARSPHPLALIVSSWFFHEVVWHSPVPTQRDYWPVPVDCKGRVDTGWICPPRPSLSDRSRVVDGVVRPILTAVETAPPPARARPGKHRAPRSGWLRQLVAAVRRRGEGDRVHPQPSVDWPPVRRAKGAGPDEHVA
ncbi:hypothetical protein ALI144C_17750 [Actinosynnema sp. ALI-1.44]|uniref:hypothetical protein n=1 Tax=Actinosynnema sp. ALI-1.44 TaxID=1933779 RepID=UPI00097C68A8|nr:hypothetical protein [Actinosynnema sp. ALI-1.44]ONI82905.1 hypothetical protein ALI144C_17750 [Actinosynnema sp. ALI-1.44]